MKIYTKTGDSGTTALFGGARVPKHHLRIEAYGTVDELNSYIGLVRDLAPDMSVVPFLIAIQEELFTIGAIMAHDPKKPQLKRPNLEEQAILDMESEIDRLDDELPPLTSFVLPGGNVAVSHSHIARCICRRAERLATELKEIENAAVPDLVLQYLNRLSDYLFTLARYYSVKTNAEEIPWIPRK